MEDLAKSQEQVQKEIEKTATDLLGSILDLQDSLCLEAEETEGIEKGERAALEYTYEALLAFWENKPRFDVARPRSIRDQDRKHILPGQHAGVFLQFIDEDGTVLRINFWGGLRTVVSLDLKDNDKTRRRLHTLRTDKVIQQPTQINWHIFMPGGEKIESWIKYYPSGRKRFVQRSLKVGEEAVDVHPNLLENDSRFEELKTSLFDSICKLTMLVPSSI